MIWVVMSRWKYHTVSLEVICSSKEKAQQCMEGLKRIRTPGEHTYWIREFELDRILWNQDFEKEIQMACTHPVWCQECDNYIDVDCKFVDKEISCPVCKTKYILELDDDEGWYYWFNKVEENPNDQ